MAGATVTSQLPEFLQDVEQRLARGIAAGLNIGAGQASMLTPIDTSTLLNSQYKQIGRAGTMIVGEVGYTAKYAVYVHDPEVKQTFRRASAEKLFLKKGFEQAEPLILEAIAGTLAV